MCVGLDRYDSTNILNVFLQYLTFVRHGVCRHVEACDELHMSAASLQCLRDAPRLSATVVIRDPSLEHLPAFLDGLPPSTRLTSKPSK